jgi:hypothetical protein
MLVLLASISLWKHHDFVQNTDWGGDYKIMIARPAKPFGQCFITFKKQ